MDEKNNRTQVRDRVRRLIDSQREFNELVNQFRRETSDPEVQRILGEIANRGLEIVNRLSRLLAIKCVT
ncbi:MAG: hypothetical protein GXY92_00655 [Syntrophomonadaceae bacterium]|nr:hypothetical protein [Syntrophomonadaceae bacterium]